MQPPGAPCRGLGAACPQIGRGRLAAPGSGCRGDRRGALASRLLHAPGEAVATIQGPALPPAAAHQRRAPPTPIFASNCSNSGASTQAANRAAACAILPYPAVQILCKLPPKADFSANGCLQARRNPLH